MDNVLQLKQVDVNVEGQQILQQVNLALSKSEIGYLLGPSGCGKTTLLKTIAGFNDLNHGELLIHDHLIASPSQSVSPEKRNIGMVFQDLALFPHLRVDQNIGFGLSASLPEEKEKRIDELAFLLGIEEQLKKYPHQLSGGQQQRVAIARAIAPGPGLLLLDEPFSSLDLELRAQLAMEIRKVLNEESITALFVSHDQNEAFAIADKIGVMRQGQMMQWSNVFDVYHRPASDYVADFIGEGVFIGGKVIDACSVSTALGLIRSPATHGFEQGQDVKVMIRPDDILHDDNSIHRAVVESKQFRGAHFLYTLSLQNEEQVLSLVPSHHDHAVNEAIGIRAEIDHLVAFAE